MPLSTSSEVICATLYCKKVHLKWFSLSSVAKEKALQTFYCSIRKRETSWNKPPEHFLYPNFNKPCKITTSELFGLTSWIEITSSSHPWTNLCLSVHSLIWSILIRGIFIMLKKAMRKCFALVEPPISQNVFQNFKNPVESQLLH